MGANVPFKLENEGKEDLWWCQVSGVYVYVCLLCEAFGCDQVTPFPQEGISD